MSSTEAELPRSYITPDGHIIDLEAIYQSHFQDGIPIETRARIREIGPATYDYFVREQAREQAKHAAKASRCMIL